MSEIQPENSSDWSYFFPPNIITYFDEKEDKGQVRKEQTEM